MIQPTEKPDIKALTGKGISYLIRFAMQIWTLVHEQMEIIRDLTAKSAASVDLQNENTCLKEELAWYKKQLFGQKSEKHVDVPVNPDQPLLTGFELPERVEPEPEKKKEIPAHTRSERKKKGTGGHSIRYPENLPVREVRIGPSTEEIAAMAKEDLIEIRTDTCDKLAILPARFEIIRYIRTSLARKGHPEEGVITETPDVWFDKCKADVSLVVDIAVKKYCDSLPLNRIQEEYRRENVFISRQTMWGWIRMMAEIIEIIYERMVEKVILSGHIFIDEIPVLLKAGEEKCRKAYVLICAGGGGGDPPYRIYAFCQNRRYATILKFIEHFTGFYHSDQYGAYVSIAGEKGLFWIPCMAHIRRKFVEAVAGDPLFRAWVLRMINNLFRYERVAWKRSPEERMRIRKELEEPIIDELIAGVIRYRQQGNYLLPQSKLANAIEYFLKASPHLKNYLKSQDARIDNNVAERSGRAIAIGRKNWLYFASERGGRVGCMLISIMQTCRALGINPREYLTDILLRVQTHPFRQIDDLLPDRWAELRKKEASEKVA